MKVAVLTLTRDRLAYTQHCFARLAEHAGCDYDHYVLDQGSTDGTAEWLGDQANLRATLLPENIGISRGLNLLLDDIVNAYEHDVIVKIDNDCELVDDGTLRDVAALVESRGALLSPRILGLRNPPVTRRTLRIGGEEILDVEQIGGVFLAAPAWLYETYRYPVDAPVWGTDDVDVCAWWRNEGGTVGYVKRLEAWHYESTDGQHQTFPDYFDRRVLEGGPA